MRLVWSGQAPFFASVFHLRLRLLLLLLRLLLLLLRRLHAEARVEPLPDRRPGRRGMQNQPGLPTIFISWARRFTVRGQLSAAREPSFSKRCSTMRRRTKSSAA